MKTVDSLTCRVCARKSSVVHFATAVFAMLLGCALANARSISVIDAGAVGDGHTLDTEAINRAISDVSSAGGGVVDFPPGVYLTGSIFLRSHVTLNLSAGAVILGSADMNDYPEQKPPLPSRRLEWGKYALVVAYQQENIAITGKGCIDGNGSYPGFAKKNREAAGWHREDAYRKRPFGLSFVECRSVRVEDITLRDLAFWTQDYLDCDDVVVDGITVDSWKHDFNNDGIDIDGSRNVRVSNSSFRVGDDAICLKASYRDCENVVVTNCHVSSMANGVKFGTASFAGFKNIAVSNIVVDEVNFAGIALEIVDGGTMDGVVINGFAMRSVGTPIFVRLGNRAARWIEAPAKGPGVLRNVTISNIQATVANADRATFASSITGLPGLAVENVTLNNINIVDRGTAQGTVPIREVPEAEVDYPENSMFGALPAWGLYVRHVKGLKIQGLSLIREGRDPRPAVVYDDVDDLQMAAMSMQAPEKIEAAVVLSDVREAQITSSMLRSEVDVFVRAEGGTRQVLLSGNSTVKSRMSLKDLSSSTEVDSQVVDSKRE